MAGLSLTRTDDGKGQVLKLQIANWELFNQKHLEKGR